MDLFEKRFVWAEKPGDAPEAPAGTPEPVSEQDPAAEEAAAEAQKQRAADVAEAQKAKDEELEESGKQADELLESVEEEGESAVPTPETSDSSAADNLTSEEIHSAISKIIPSATISAILTVIVNSSKAAKELFLNIVGTFAGGGEEEVKKAVEKGKEELNTLKDDYQGVVDQLIASKKVPSGIKVEDDDIVLIKQKYKINTKDDLKKYLEENPSAEITGGASLFQYLQKVEKAKMALSAGEPKEGEDPVVPEQASTGPFQEAPTESFDFEKGESCAFVLSSGEVLQIMGKYFRINGRSFKMQLLGIEGAFKSLAPDGKGGFDAVIGPVKGPGSFPVHVSLDQIGSFVAGLTSKSSANEFSHKITFTNDKGKEKSKNVTFVLV